MNHTVKLSSDLEARLQALANARGLSTDIYLTQLVEQALPAGDPPLSTRNPPLRTGRGILSKYGPAPSAEEIDEVRREMWKNFPRDID